MTIKVVARDHGEARMTTFIKTVKAPESPPRESAYAALNGVSVDWLRRVFRMSSRTVERKLTGLRTIAVTGKGVPLYDLAEAAQRLVKPKMDLNEYLSDITVDDLPDKLKEAFWNAKLKEQRYLKNAGELWRTEAVIQLFGSTLKDVKERMRLIPELGEKSLGLTPDQAEGLRKIVSRVQEEVWLQIQNLEPKTPSSVAEMNKIYGAEEDADYESPTAVRGDDGFEY